MAPVLIVAREPEVKAFTVFRVPELCNLIVDQMGALDVLRAPQVSKEFAAFIHGSKCAQKKLFLLADDKGDINAPTGNALIFHAIRGKQITRNPDDLTAHEPRQTKSGHTLKLRAWPYSSMTCLSFLLISEIDESSSCYKMFLTQPPVTKATLSICIAQREEPDSEKWKERILQDANGIRFEQVAAEIADFRNTLEDEQYLDLTMSHVEIYHLPYDPKYLQRPGLSRTLRVMGGGKMRDILGRG